MIELSLASGRPLAELYELEEAELATIADVLAEQAGR